MNLNRELANPGLPASIDPGEMLQQIHAALWQSPSLPQLLQACSDIFVRQLQLQLARIWLFNPQEQILELQASAGVYTHLSGHYQQIALGQFLIGRVATSRQAVWSDEIEEHPWVTRPEWFRRQGITAFVGYPLWVDEQLVGLLALFSDAPISRSLEAPLNSITHSLGLAIVYNQQQRRLLQSLHELSLPLTSNSRSLQAEVAAHYQAMHTLSDTSNRLQALLAAVPDPIFVFDAAGTYLDCLAGITEQLLIPRASIIGKRLHDLLPLDVADQIAAAIQQVLQQNALVVIEYVLPIEGTLRHREGRLMPCGDNQVLLIARDLTERRKAELQVQEREQRFRRMADNAPMMLWITDHTGACQYINQRWCEFTGTTMDENLGFGWLRAVHLDDRAIAHDYFVTASNEQGSFRVEYRLRRHDGRYRWVLDSATPWLDEAGDFHGYIGSVIDITERHEWAAAVQERELLLQTLSDNLPNGFLYQIKVGPGEQRNFTYLSAGVEKISGGVSREAALSNAHLLINQIIPEDWAQLTAATEYAARTSATLDIQFRRRLPSGEIRWIQRRAAPQDMGNHYIWHGVELDVTEAKQAEQSLLESTRRYSALFQAANMGIALADPEGQLLEVNHTFAEMLGYETGALIGVCFASLIHPEDRHTYTTWLQGEATTLNRRWIEQRLLHRDSSTVWMRLVFETLTDHTNQPWLISVVAEDITAIKRAEGRISLYQRTFETIAQGIVITDQTLPKRPIVYVNPGFERLTGYQATEIIGRTCRLLQGPETDPATCEAIRSAIANRQPYTVEILNYNKAGKPYWIALSLAPIFDEFGTLTHVVGIQTDLTDFKRLEAQYHQAQKMEAIGRLTGGLAHDFNNLLTVINGYSDLILRRMPMSDPQRARLEQVLEAGHRAAALTRQLLTFSRKQVILPVVLDLNALITDLEKLLSRLIGEDIQLTTQLAPDLWPIKADPSQFEQAIMNLSINARDAMPTGGYLSIATENLLVDAELAARHPELTAGPYIVLTISDTGQGMDDVTKTHLFEPFFTTKPLGKGTGLGLATVYGIVQQGNGVIEVESEVNLGTTFRLYLPSTVGREEPAKVVSFDLPAPHTASEQHEGPATILLVEDNDQIRNLAVTTLRELGHTVWEAANGLAALQLVATFSPALDLLVTDVIMPGMSGRRLSDQLLQQYQQLKVLFVSGYSDNEIAPHGILETGVLLLEKPYTLTLLRDKVREVLDS